MNWTSAISGVLAAIFTQTIVFAFLGFIGKTLTKHISESLLEDHKAQLRAQGDSEIEKLKDQLGKTTELYRAQLRKSEWAFQKEYEASASLNIIYREFVPNRSAPDQEWYDALDSISDKFQETESCLRNFIVRYSPALLTGELDRLEHCAYLANDGYLSASGPEDEEARQIADRLYNSFKALNEALHDRVRSQFQVDP